MDCPTWARPDDVAQLYGSSRRSLDTFETSGVLGFTTLTQAYVRLFEGNELSGTSGVFIHMPGYTEDQHNTYWIVSANQDDLGQLARAIHKEPNWHCCAPRNAEYEARRLMSANIWLLPRSE